MVVESHLNHLSGNGVGHKHRCVVDELKICVSVVVGHSGRAENTIGLRVHLLEVLCNLKAVYQGGCPSGAIELQNMEYL